VDLPIVTVIDIGHRRRHPALGHNGVGFAQQRLANKPYRNATSRCLNSSTKACTTGTNDKDVVFVCCVINH
jgi:hypothetical protein